jgi:hypothetical protein
MHLSIRRGLSIFIRQPVEHSWVKRSIVAESAVNKLAAWPIVGRWSSLLGNLNVTGSTSGGDIKSMFSTAQSVLKNSPCDVLVVRSSVAADDEPIKALACFGMNDWEESIDAFKATLRASKPGDQIEAVYLVNAVSGPQMAIPPGNGTISQKIERALHEAINEVPNTINREDVEMKPTVLFSGVENPIKVLVDYAEEQNANLLSVGSGSVARVLSPANSSHPLPETSSLSVLVAAGRHMRASRNVSEEYYVEDPQKWVQTKSFI